MLRRTLLVMIAIIAMCGCDALLLDDKAEVDAGVQYDMSESKQAKALPFFTGGGKLEYCEDPKAIADVLVPLLQRMESEFKLEPIALIDEEVGDDYAYEIVARLPSDATALSSLDAAIKEADAKYAGVVYAEWGRKWLVLNMESPDEEVE